MAAGGCALGAIVGLTVHLPLYYEVVTIQRQRSRARTDSLAAISTVVRQ
jgi:hypothetical protein